MTWYEWIIATVSAVAVVNLLYGWTGDLIDAHRLRVKRREYEAERKRMIDESLEHYERRKS